MVTLGLDYQELLAGIEELPRHNCTSRGVEQRNCRGHVSARCEPLVLAVR
jgi:hypothetical protein